MVDTPSAGELFALDREHTSGGMGRRPVTIVSGRGARLIDCDGREYIDLSTGNGWGILGHGHPRVTAAIQEQAGRLICFTEAGANEQRALWFADLSRVLGEKIGASHKGHLDIIHPCNSGTEAVECAIKVSRYFTGRSDIVAAKRGFHGRTLGSLSATWKAEYRKPFVPLVPGFRHVTFNQVDELDQAIDDRTAALLLELVQGEGGVHPATSEFLARAAELCRERGALLVADEVQTGLGRTGAWFASELLGCQPDIIVLGKALGGGIPMGAAAWRRDLGKLPGGSHASTFGGNPLACAASRAVLQALAEEQLPERGRDLGQQALERLRAMDLPGVRDIRGKGFMIGLELKQSSQGPIKALMERGVWALPAGKNVLRLLPPLVIPREDLDQALDLVGEVLRAR